MRLTALGRWTASGGVTLAVIGALAGMTAVLGVGVVLMALVFVAGSVVVEPPHLDLARRASATDVERGVAVEIGLHFTSVARRRSGALVIVETVNGEQRAAALGSVVPGEMREIRYGIDTSRRGVVAVGPLMARRTDPFGLVTADRTFGGSITVNVRPRRFDVTMLPLGRLRDLDGPTQEQSDGSSTFHRLREYVHGDDLRRVHWRSSAKTGQLMVKHMVDTTRPELVVVLDNRAVAVTAPDFEHAVEIAASVVWAAEREGFPVSLVLSSSSSRRHLSPLDELTSVGRTDAESLADLADGLDAHGRSLIIVTGTLDPGDVDTMTLVSRNFSPAYLVSVVADRESPLISPPGVTTLECATAEEFVARWEGL